MAPRQRLQRLGGGRLHHAQPPPPPACCAVVTGTRACEDVGVGDGNNDKDKEGDKDCDGNKDDVATKLTTRRQRRRDSNDDDYNGNDLGRGEDIERKGELVGDDDNLASTGGQKDRRGGVQV